MKSDDLTKRGARQRLMRNAAELTQAQLAETANVNRSKICLAERGDIELSDEEQRRIDRVLDKKLQGKAGKTVPLRTFQTAPALKPSESPLPDVDDVRQRKFTRLQARLTQTQVSARTGIPQSRLSLWEQGRASLSPEELKAWLRETAIADPWFRLEVSSDAGRELLATNKRLREENEQLRAELNKTKAQFYNAEEIAALRYAQIQELAERLERL